VARALLAEGVPVASRQVVDEDETALEEALRGAVEAASLVVVLAQPGGSSGTYSWIGMSARCARRVAVSSAAGGDPPGTLAQLFLSVNS